MAEKLEFDPPPKAGERKLEFDSPPPDPASFNHLLGHPKEGVTGNKEPPDNRSETEKRLTADTLRTLLEARGGTGSRSLSDVVTGSEARHAGSLTERATDWLVPGAKNVMGGVLSLGRGLVTGDGTLGENWSAGVNAEKQFRDVNRDATAGPLGYAADAAGFVTSAGKPGGAIGSTASIGTPTVQATAKAAQTLPGAVKSGAIQGMVSGAAENSQDLSSAIQGGITGGATGGTVAAGAHTVTGLIGRLADNKLKAAAAAEHAGQRGPTPAEHFTQAGDKFKELDNAGIQFDQGQARRLGGMLPQVLKDAKYTKTASPELTDALEAVYGAGAKGAPPLTFTELQALRGKVSEAGQSNPQNANLRRIAGRVTGMIDDFVEKNQPNINQTGADLAKLYPEARKLWRTGVLGDTIQDVEKIAANKAAVQSAGAEDIARKNLVQQANKDIKAGLPSLPPAAEAARQKAIEGTWKQNTADAVAKASGNWQGNLAAGAGLGGLLTQATGMPFHATGPVGGLLGVGAGKAAHAAAKGIANREAQTNMDTLVRSIMTGSADKPQVWDMPRDLLASLLSRRAAQRGAVYSALPGGEYVINELTKNR
jgi:hypothetical protein